MLPWGRQTDPLPAGLHSLVFTRTNAGAGHSIRFWRLAPFPFAGLPIVASDAALDHFVAPFVARQDEANEIAAAKAKPAKGNHDNDLQQHLVT